jgi:phosphatidylserine decarboxylase
MKMRSKPVFKLTLAEQLNFLLTNRIPRRLLTQLIGWYSRIRSRRLTKLSIWIWQRFADDLRLEESVDTEYISLQQCFTRSLRGGARPVCADADALVSPCDAVVGEFGDIAGTELIQAKGFPYTLSELLSDADQASRCRDGRFVTLRLKSSMYHRFHAPTAGVVRSVRYISGDTWNVNPIALKKIERLYCRNERAVVTLHAADPQASVTLVPIAAVLVASLRLDCLSQALNMHYRGPDELTCNRTYSKGEEMGYFEQGSTIVMLTSRKFQFVDELISGQTIRMGARIMNAVD